MRDRTTLILTGVALALAGAAWWQGGPDLALAGLVRGARILVEVVPLLVAAFLIAGLTQTLVTHEVVTRWLGTGSGWRGIAVACIGGSLVPGGPYVYYPIAGALLQAGAGLGVLVAFVTAKNLWSLTRLPLEFALLGSQLTLVRFAVTLFVPPMMGLLAEALFGRHVERIREAMVL
ncbi:MAG: permease [Anaerolineae bacterium]